MSWPLQVDSGFLYLEMENASALARMSLSDFSWTPVLQSSWIPHIKWTHASPYVYSADNTAPEELWRVAETGGGPVLVAKAFGYAGALTADGPTVFVADSNNDMVHAFASGDGTALWSVASGEPSPDGITVDGNYVYWANRAGKTVMQIPVAGGTPTVFATDQEYANRLVVHGGYVYWLNETGPNSIQRSPIPSHEPEVLVSSDVAGQPQDLAVDDWSIYWTDQGYSTSRLMKASLTGASPEVVLNAPGELYAIAVDEACIYFSDHDWPAGRNLVGRVRK